MNSGLNGEAFDYLLQEVSWNPFENTLIFHPSSQPPFDRVLPMYFHSITSLEREATACLIDVVTMSIEHFWVRLIRRVPSVVIFVVVVLNQTELGDSKAD